MINAKPSRVVAFCSVLAGTALLASAPAHAVTRYIGDTAPPEASSGSQYFNVSLRDATTDDRLISDRQSGANYSNGNQASSRGSSVPESATSGMVLAGIGLLIMIARRRTFIR